MPTRTLPTLVSLLTNSTNAFNHLIQRNESVGLLGVICWSGSQSPQREHVPARAIANSELSEVSAQAFSAANPTIKIDQQFDRHAVNLADQHNSACHFLARLQFRRTAQQ